MSPLQVKLLECIDLEKLSIILVEDVVLGSLKKIVEDSSNKFDDAAFEYVAPLAKEKGEALLKDLILKLKA